jgi:hypothetical protein
MAATDRASTLETSKVAFIANLDKSAGSDIGIADYTFAITFLTEATDSHSRLFPTENQIWMMLCHFF